MSMTPQTPIEAGSLDAETYCYLHPKEPTRLRCSRCERPICGRCAIPASVGQHCPNCVAEARRSAPKVRSALRASAPVVFAILIVNAVLWLIQNLAPERGFTDIVTLSFGASPLAIASGEWYRLITPVFLHAPESIWHIGFNSYALFLFGPHVEQAFGRVRFLVLYLIAGFGGSAVSYAFGECGTLGVGASGAIFGILGALLVFLYNRRRSTFVREYMKNIVFLIVINLVLGQLIANIDNLAHVGGLIGGAAVAAAYDRGPDQAVPAPVQVSSVLFVIAAIAALVMWRTATFTC